MTANQQTSIHWNHFVALENDLEQTARHIELHADNYSTYSIELAHLLLASASEVDVVAKALCQSIDSTKPAGNINQYHDVIVPRFPNLKNRTVFIHRYGLQSQPWSSWASGQSPRWWQMYNKVKHERSQYFSEASLFNALHALAGLLVLLVYLYHDDWQRDGINSMKPEAKLLTFEPDYYRDPLAGAWYCKRLD